VEGKIDNWSMKELSDSPLLAAVGKSNWRYGREP
jgi:hypothetical protein